MKRWTAVAVVIAVLGRLAVGQITQQSSTPSLLETEAWITKAVENHASATQCTEYNPRMPGDSTVENLVAFDCHRAEFYLTFDGCAATLVTVHTHRRSDKSFVKQYDYERDKADNLRLVFNLADIDPSTIKTNPPQGSFGPLHTNTYHKNVPFMKVVFKTTNEKEVIRKVVQGATRAYDSSEIDPAWWDSLAFDLDYAPRFVHALKHAVELCGGKPSAF
ncbi:MAG TPA: hypothetical protein VFQ43_04090 [Nitrososphaera sp.]|nr:hypothetical protein [Nitrososphaera sp.]